MSGGRRLSLQASSSSARESFSSRRVSLHEETIAWVAEAIRDGHETVTPFSLTDLAYPTFSMSGSCQDLSKTSLPGP